MILYTVIPIRRRAVSGQPKGHKLPPRYDLRPMNHAAACNWMDACRNQWTDYEIHPWPADVPHPGKPILAKGYRRRSNTAH